MKRKPTTKERKPTAAEVRVASLVGQVSAHLANHGAHQGQLHNEIAAVLGTVRALETTSGRTHDRFKELEFELKDNTTAVSKLADELAGVTQAVESLQRDAEGRVKTSNACVELLLEELAAKTRLNTQALLALNLYGRASGHVHDWKKVPRGVQCVCGAWNTSVQP